MLSEGICVVNSKKEGSCLKEIQDFLYELNKYTTQAHTLKDCFEKLSDSEKDMIMNHAPEMKEPPDIAFQQTVQWLQSLNAYFAVTADELKS